MRVQQMMEMVLPIYSREGKAATAPQTTGQECSLLVYRSAAEALF